MTRAHPERPLTRLQVAALALALQDNGYKLAEQPRLFRTFESLARRGFISITGHEAVITATGRNKLREVAPGSVVALEAVAADDGDADAPPPAVCAPDRGPDALAARFPIHRRVRG